MAYRVTNQQLDAVCDRINKALKAPTQAWVDGVAQVGHYYVDHAYGGVCLHRISGDGGSVSTPLGQGCTTKRELCDQMHAFLAGVAAARA